MFAFGVAILASYVAGMIRPINSAEIRAADSALIELLSWTGVLLVASDGVPSFARLRTLLLRLVACGAFLSLVGIAQFLTKDPLTQYISIPGLTVNETLLSVISRGGLPRPSGTATHPIEFGVVITMVLPIAIAGALLAADRSRQVRRWLLVLIIGVGVPISISRSAIIGAIVGLAIAFPAWSKSARKLVLLFVAVLGSAMFMLSPHLLSTLLSLFTGVSDDGSISSRTDSYLIAWDFFTRSPIVGRGMFTFQPTYRIFDNQFLRLIVDAGAIGLLTCVALFLTGIIIGWSARRRSDDPELGLYAQSLAAAVAVGAVSCTAFDTFSFPMATGMIFFILGCTGAIYRLASPRPPAEITLLSDAAEPS